MRRVQKTRPATCYNILMALLTNILTELSKLVTTATTQLTSSNRAKISRQASGSSSDISFTKNFYARAKQAGLSERDGQDVYYSGYPSKNKQNTMLKDYNGYQIGVYYFKDARTGKPVISSIWKRESA